MRRLDIIALRFVGRAVASNHAWGKYPCAILWNRIMFRSYLAVRQVLQIGDTSNIHTYNVCNAGNQRMS